MHNSAGVDVVEPRGHVVGNAPDGVVRDIFLRAREIEREVERR